MESFVFYNKTRLIFGDEAEIQFVPFLPSNVKRILLHYGGGTVVKNGLLQRIEQYLENSGFETVTFGGVQPNPKLDLVKKGIVLCRKEKIDFILAIGGGSVIDSAKAISFGINYEGDVWDFFSSEKKAVDTLPVGCVLTIPASGSESSKGAVITNDEGLKRCGEGEDSRPVFAALNPRLTCTLSDYQTACGIADMMAHIMERYFTPTKYRNFTDELCEGALRSIIQNAKIIKNDPGNIDARSELMLAGTIAHNDMLGMGRIGDWASHMIEHELSGMFDIAHGAGLSIIFPAWMRYIYHNHIEIFAQFARNVWDITVESDEEAAVLGIEALEKFWNNLGLPINMRQAHIFGENFYQEMAERAVCNGELGGLQKLSKIDVFNIFNVAN